GRRSAGPAAGRDVHADGQDRHGRGGGADRALALLGPVLVHHRRRDPHRRGATGREQAAADVPSRPANGARPRRDGPAEPGITPAAQPAADLWPICQRRRMLTVSERTRSVLRGMSIRLNSSKRRHVMRNRWLVPAGAAAAVLVIAACGSSSTGNSGSGGSGGSGSSPAAASSGSSLKTTKIGSAT